MARGETYEEFIKKFEKKELPKTTDDCYTPENLWSVILDYVKSKYGITENEIVRPFYPGGDYTKENYNNGVVVDNPPFSLQKEIIKYYMEHGVRFFLFCSALTPPLYRDVKQNYCIIHTCANTTYANGANVKTSFVTNLEQPGIRTDTDLRETLDSLFRKPAKRIKLPAPYMQASVLTRKHIEYKYTPDDYEIVKTPAGFPRVYGPVLKFKNYDVYKQLLNILEEG